MDGDCNCTERCFRHFNLNIFTEVNLLSWSRKFNHFRRISQISSCAINSILDIDPTVGDMFRSCLAEIKNAVYMEAIPLKTSQIFPYLRNKKKQAKCFGIHKWMITWQSYRLLTFLQDAFKCFIDVVLYLRNKESSIYKKMNKSLPQLKNGKYWKHNKYKLALCDRGRLLCCYGNK